MERLGIILQHNKPADVKSQMKQANQLMTHKHWARFSFSFLCFCFFISPRPPDFAAFTPDFAAFTILLMFCRTARLSQSIAGEPPRNSTEQWLLKCRVPRIPWRFETLLGLPPGFSFTWLGVALSVCISD